MEGAGNPDAMQVKVMPVCSFAINCSLSIGEIIMGLSATEKLKKGIKQH